jgi:SAM-dependent methyltransferase
VSVILAPPLAADEAHRLKPRNLREAIEPHVRELARQQTAGQSIATLRPLADATSRKVADQYEAAPYPRWTSLHVSAPGSLRRSLAAHFTAGRLAFMDGAFDVLVAGCGTGQQALQAAAAYGTGARMLAMDLSRTSPAMPAMAARYEMPNIAFCQGDISMPRCSIENSTSSNASACCTMADWRRLAGAAAAAETRRPDVHRPIQRDLTRSGRCVGSQVIRPGCSDDVRAYRRDLLLRDARRPAPTSSAAISTPQCIPGSRATTRASTLRWPRSRFPRRYDWYSMAHIETGHPDAFAGEFPASGRPGRLADWAAFELRHPRTFDAMYRFWVARGG